MCWRRSFALKHLCVLLYLCRCVHSVPSPDLEISQLLFLYIISLFLSPSLLLLRHPVSFLPILVESEVSQRISSLKKKKERNLSSVLTSTWIILPLSSRSLCSIWSPLPVLCNSSFVSFTEFSAPKFLFKSFHYFRNCSYVHYFYSSANWSVFGSFLLACWASSWHYLEFSTCLITILQDVKLVHG